MGCCDVRRPLGLLRRSRIEAARLTPSALDHGKWDLVDITIGVQNQAREINLESDATADEVAQRVTAAVTDGVVLELVDTKGRRVLVPSAAIGYVEIGTEEPRKVGFGAV